jgi:iron complex transport system substrate-binding protein
MTSVVSLLPSGTEWVYALGREGALAGVTFECDHPVAARARHPIVVHGMPTEGLTPGEIDAAVRARIESGESLYQLDSDALTRIAPDVVITQDLCRVCALPADDVATAIDRVGCPSHLVTLDPHRLDDVLDGAVDVATALGDEAAGRRLRRELGARLESVASRVRGRERPQVLVLEWTDPPFLAGHWVPDMVVAAGGQVLLADPGERSVSTEWPAVGAVDPDITVVAPCGFGLSDAVEYGRAVLDRLPASSASAASAVWAIDAGAFVTRPGPRVVDGVEALAHVLHPDAVSAPPPGRVARLRP